MQGTENWTGLEVEGRFSDIMTVFRRFKLPENWKEFPHVYFTIEAVREFIKKDNWDEVLDILNLSYKMVTIEVDTLTLDFIPKRIFNHAHILYRVQIPKNDIDKLKNFDTITMDNGQYNVYVISKDKLQRVTADQYKYDRLK